MTSIANLFSNFDDLTKKKSVTDSATAYTKHKYNSRNPTPALTQGERFKNYQNKIKKNLIKKAEQLTGKEGFKGIDLSELDLTPDGLTEQSEQIIQNNNYSSKQLTISNLQKQYQNTLTQYEKLLAEISGSVNSYVNRVNPANPYLGKNISFTTGKICYVTQQGVVKLYPNRKIFGSAAGLNGCPASSEVVKINLPWISEYNSAGVTISTNPPLVTGTPMTAGQSCGNEGVNVYVNELLNNPTIKYQGCYADNTSSPLMTFIGGAPAPPSGNLQNGSFDQPQIASNTYQYISSNSTVPGWDFYAVLINNSSAWGYPIPYPAGNQALCIQTTQICGQWIQLSSGTYTLSFYACGRPGYSGANTINVYCGQTGNPQSMPTIYTFTPPTTAWQQYTTTFNISTSGNYSFGFYGTIYNDNNSTAIQNVQLSSSGSTSGGSYTYEMCKNGAINSEYQYFALQDVNPDTSQGYCAVSNDQPSITKLGPGQVPSGQVALWASKTSKQTGNSAILSLSGALSVISSSGQAVFNTPNSKANPSNYLGCYGDAPNRAMPLYNGGSQQYSNAQCQQIAQQNGATYYGLQNSTSGTNAQCALSTNLQQTTEYGKAGNCTKISDGSYSGGGYSNSVYNTSLPQSNYFLILQDDGNMVIYRGTSPSDNQGVIWATGTNSSKLQSANPNYAAAKGKYGQNFITQGSTLAAGDFVGSTSGNMALIMQSDGNLVLYTFRLVTNCQKMADNNQGGGLSANAIYDIGKVGVQANMGKLAYIDQNSELHAYPASNFQYTNTYTKFDNTNSPYNDIPEAVYANATAEQCQTSCNNNAECAGFVFDSNSYCWPKNSGMYPAANTLTSVVNDYTYIKNAMPATPPIGVSSTTNKTNSITYNNYANGGALSNEYGLANATSVQQQQLAQLQTQMNLLSNQISGLTTEFGDGSQMATKQMTTNVQGVGEYLTDLTQTNKKIQNYNTSIDNILKDSDIVVLQKNYDYLFWSILAAGSVLVAMNIVKK
jgi:hypothetical protein